MFVFAIIFLAALMVLGLFSHFAKSSKPHGSKGDFVPSTETKPGPPRAISENSQLLEGDKPSHGFGIASELSPTTASNKPTSLGRAAVEPALADNMMLAVLINYFTEFKATHSSRRDCSLKQKLDEIGESIDKIATPGLWLKSFAVSEEYEHISSGYVLAIVALLLDDINAVSQEVDKIDELGQLDEVERSLNKSAYLTFNLSDALKPSANALAALKILDGSIADASTRLVHKRNALSRAQLLSSINDKSRILSNIGFFLLSSADISFVPNTDVYEGHFDFKAEYFPTFQAIKWQDYATAKLFFELAIEADSNNLLPKIYKQVCVLQADMRNEDACCDREQVIAELKNIVEEFPGNAISHIELAVAYSALSLYEEATSHIKKALKISPDSVYLRYASAMIYRDACDKEREYSIIDYTNGIITNHPRLSYLQAIGYSDRNRFLNAFMRIDDATHGGKSMDYFHLKEHIVSILKMQISSQDYESLYSNDARLADLSEAKKLTQRKDKFSIGYKRFTAFSKIEFSNDYSSSLISDKEDCLVTIHLLPNRHSSIVFIDLNLLLPEFIGLGIFVTPINIEGGEYYLDEDTGDILLKNLNFRNLLKEKLQEQALYK